MNVIKIDGKDYYWKVSNGVIIEWENKHQKKISSIEESNLGEVCDLFYLSLVHGCRAKRVDFPFDFNQFLDADCRNEIVQQMTQSFMAVEKNLLASTQEN
jgi:hypothetical protein